MVYELYNSIYDKFDIINANDPYMCLKNHLIISFKELGRQENLDKAFKLLRQPLENLNRIDKEQLNNLKYNLSIEYLKLTMLTLEDVKN